MVLVRLVVFGGFGFDTGADLWEHVASASWPTGFCDRLILPLLSSFGWRGLAWRLSLALGLDWNVITVENRLGRFDHRSSSVIDARDKSSILRGMLLF